MHSYLRFAFTNSQVIWSSYNSCSEIQNSAKSSVQVRYHIIPKHYFTSGVSDGIPSDNTEEDEDWSRGSGEDPEMYITDTPRRPASASGGGDSPPGIPATTELDRKVQLAARLMQKNCNCSNGKCEKLKVKKVGEGKYNIAGKNVFVRVS